MEARVHSGQVVIKHLTRPAEAAKVAGAAVSLSVKALFETDWNDHNARTVTIADDDPDQSLFTYIAKLVLLQSAVRGTSPQDVLTGIGGQIENFGVDEEKPFSPGTETEG